MGSLPWSGPYLVVVSIPIENGRKNPVCGTFHKAKVGLLAMQTTKGMGCCFVVSIHLGVAMVNQQCVVGVREFNYLEVTFDISKECQTTNPKPSLCHEVPCASKERNKVQEVFQEQSVRAFIKQIPLPTLPLRHVLQNMDTISTSKV